MKLAKKIVLKTESYLYYCQEKDFDPLLCLMKTSE